MMYEIDPGMIDEKDLIFSKPGRIARMKHPMFGVSDLLSDDTLDTWLRHHAIFYSEEIAGVRGEGRCPHCGVWTSAIRDQWRKCKCGEDIYLCQGTVFSEKGYARVVGDLLEKKLR